MVQIDLETFLYYEMFILKHLSEYNMGLKVYFSRYEIYGNIALGIKKIMSDDE